MSPVSPRHPVRRASPGLAAAAGLAATALLCLGLAGCKAEPAVSAAPSTSSSTSPSAAAPSPSATADAGQDITLPSACEQLYSADMLASLQQQAVLNDPGVTMYSSQIVAALEVLDSGVPTLRCSWGVPSESGLATTVSIVDAAQSTSILEALTQTGYACVGRGFGTLCTFEQESITQDDVLVKRGESHFLAGNGWVSTAWITFHPDGYTEDIVGTLWG